MAKRATAKKRSAVFTRAERLRADKTWAEIKRRGGMRELEQAYAKLMVAWLTDAVRKYGGKS